MAARQALAVDGGSQALAFRPIDNPYRWLSWPTLDLNLATEQSGVGDPSLSVNVDMAADVLKMSGRLRTVTSHDGAADSLRLSLFRENAQAEELGILKAKRFALGDINSPAQPLTSRSDAGRGFVVSNHPLFKPEMFDQTTVRGPLPAQWEAELYDGDDLLAFVTEADNQGDYVFEEVPLRPGYNRLVVKLFGPHGEKSQRTITQFVGAELCPENEWRYQFGLVDPSRQLLDSSLSTAEEEDATGLAEPANDLPTDNADDPLDAPGQQHAFVSLDYGLSHKASLRLDLRLDQDSAWGTLGFARSLWGGYGLARIASASNGGYAIQTQYQRPLSQSASFSINALDYGDLQSEVSGQGDEGTQRELKARLDWRINSGSSSLATQSTVAHQQRHSGSSSLLATNRISGGSRSLKWNHTLRYSGGDQQASVLQGELLMSRRIAGIRWRSSILYRLDRDLSWDSISLAGKSKVGTNYHLQGNLNYNMSSRRSSVETALSRQWGPLAISAKAGLAEDSQWSFGLGLSMALFRDSNLGGYRTARHGLTRSGAIAPRIFDDKNDNGVFDSDDETVSGARFIVDNALRSQESNASGIVLVDGLTSARGINAEMQLASLPDPFMRPREAGRSMTLRPGQVLSYDHALTMSAEVDGSLYARKGDHLSPIAGVSLEARTADGLVVATT
ncbi:hypothetical protein OAS86_07305, partial [Gammaproteobacteria bacterium]|nr:hypothetical protein [Gammaproteobacteria bacterium]